MEFYRTFILVTVIASSCGSVDIGKYLKICDRNSLDVNDCLVDAIQKGIATMSDGVKDLGVPAVDPYHQKELRVEYNNNQILVKMTMRNIHVHGLKQAKVKDARLRADEDNFYLEVDMTSPQIYINGSYTAEGRYNSLKINAVGMFTCLMTDLVYTWKLKGKPEKIKDETYIRIDSFYMRPDVTGLKVHLANDNPETREITKLGNDFASTNWKTLYRELLPHAQANWNKIGIRVANKIFLKVPYDQLFPAQS